MNVKRIERKNVALHATVPVILFLDRTDILIFTTFALLRERNHVISSEEILRCKVDSCRPVKRPGVQYFKSVAELEGNRDESKLCYLIVINLCCSIGDTISFYPLPYKLKKNLKLFVVREIANE